MSHDITIFECREVATHCVTYHDDELKAAKVARNHMESCLNYWGYSHDITVSSDTSYSAKYADKPDDEDWMQEELDYFEGTWLDGHSDKSADSNLMLLANNPPGPSGKASAPGQGALKKYTKDLANHSYATDRYGNPSYDKEKRIRGSIHEIGHNYGMHHCDGWRYDNNGTTYATPHGCEKDGVLQSENNCGAPCSGEVIETLDHWYDSCAENNL